MYEENILTDKINVPKPFIKTSIFEIFYENINLYLLLSPTYHIFKVVSSIDQIFF